MNRSKVKVGFVSLGCSKNLMDTEVMLAKLVKAGYQIVPDDIEADVIIINTCAFIESAKKEAIDTTTPTGKFMLTIFGAVAELEREYILQRQAEGIAIAKEQGVYKGRQPIIRPDFERVTASWRDGKITAVEAMRKLDMKPSTFYRKVKEMGL